MSDISLTPLRAIGAPPAPGGARTAPVDTPAPLEPVDAGISPGVARPDKPVGGVEVVVPTVASPPPQVPRPTAAVEGWHLSQPGQDLRGWGSRSQIMATLHDLQDVVHKGNGLWGEQVGNLTDRNPLLLKLKEATTMGVTSAEAVEILQAFVCQAEARWGQPISNLPASDFKDGNLFLAQKALALTRMGRTPADVTDGFHLAQGSVDGQPIADRSLFYQHFKPLGPPSGRTIVVSPGFQETGRNFYQQIEAMTREGHDVVVMDHQWAGQSEGSPGGMDRGFGVARDVAAMAAKAQSMLPQNQVVLFGNSMGAGPGVLGALVLNDNGLIQLKGPPMPMGLSAVLQAPFLKASPNWLNRLLGFASHVPGLNHLAVPSSGVPVLTEDPVAAQEGAQTAVLEGDTAQLATMTAAQPDLARILGLIANGHGPQGHLAVVHGDHDPLADPQMSRWLKQMLPDQVDLNVVASHDHVLEQSPTEQRYGLEALRSLTG